MIRVGLIGNGKISDTHKDAYARMDDVSLEVYCDANPANLEGIEGARLYTDVTEMLQKEQGKLDYVDICLPTFLHPQVSIQAMEMGFHVLCEKPMARTAEDAQRMLEAAQRTGKKLMIAHCVRFGFEEMEMKKTILSGELGKVRSAEFSREGNDYIDPSRISKWFFNGDLSGGGMLDTHIHDVDLIRWFFGMPKAVSSGAVSVLTNNAYDAMSTNYYYDNGLFVRASSDWTIAHDKFNTRTIRINFEKGYIFNDRTPGREAFVKVHEDGTVTDMLDQGKRDVYYNEILHFIDCIRNDKEISQCPPVESAEALQIVLAEIRSADAMGEKIEL